jgi:hypothetical protein
VSTPSNEHADDRPSETFVSMDAATTARICELAAVLGTADQDVLMVALGVLEWYMSIDASDSKQVMVVDLESSTATLPKLKFERIDEAGVMSMPLLPSEPNSQALAGLSQTCRSLTSSRALLDAQHGSECSFDQVLLITSELVEHRQC